MRARVDTCALALSVGRSFRRGWACRAVPCTLAELRSASLVFYWRRRRQENYSEPKRAAKLKLARMGDSEQCTAGQSARLPNLLRALPAEPTSVNGRRTLFGAHFRAVVSIIGFK